jgi:chloride channel protein, CIC family
MRSPFTGIVFAIELTHDLNMLLPLLVASFLAHAFTVLTLKRSILTEKIARRGYHLSREYALDPLEILFVREVMQGPPARLPLNVERAHPVFAYSDEPLRAVVYRMAETGSTEMPVVDRDDPARVLGTISLSDLLRARSRNLEEERTRERVLRLPLRRARQNGKATARATSE